MPQASIEGNNSVFSRKFWNMREFSSVSDVEEKLEWFNSSFRKYTSYSPTDNVDQKEDDFKPIIYFTRQVREKEDGSKGQINILNKEIAFPSEYVNYHVLGEWKLKEEQLLIRFEKDQNSEVIKTVNFPINERSKGEWSEVLT